MPLKPLSESELKAVADRLISVACRQRDTSITLRQPKLDKILKAEELYFNVVNRTLKGRFNIPLPIVSGFVDTLLAKIDDEIDVDIESNDDADKIKCRKCKALWKRDSSSIKGKWAMKDLLTKKLAIFSGIGINKIYSESDPKYKNHLSIVDLFDFHCDVTAGYDIEEHLFCGVDNIFRTKYDVKHATHYNAEQVTKLLSFSTTEQYRKNQLLYQNRQNRFKALQLDVESNNYTGVDLFNFSEWNLYDTVTGRRFYMLFDPFARMWVRICPLEDITGEPDEEGDMPGYMFKIWHTHPDAWNCLSKAPVDDVIPIAIAMKSMVNFMFDEVQKHLWGQRLYDPELISDPSMLEWDRPDKLIMATLPNGKKLSDAVWQFPTGDKSTVTINMLEYFRNFIGTESGITPQAKGESDEKVLGIAQINVGEVADRLGLTNKWYNQFNIDLAHAWLKGAQMCLTEKQALRIVGQAGSESAEIGVEDVKFTVPPHITITGTKSEQRKNQQLNDARNTSLTQVLSLLPDSLNAKLAAESLLKNGYWNPDEVAALLDVSTDGDETQSVRAAQAIDEIINGKQPKLFIGATTRFITRIIKFAEEREPNPAAVIKLMKYAQAHKGIVIQNMAREAMIRNMNAPQGDPSMPAKPNSAANAPTRPTPVNPSPAPAANQQ